MKKTTHVLTRNILATVAYYDVLDYPMTAFEIWKYIICADYSDAHAEQHVRIEDVLHALHDPALVIHVHHKNGFYFLQGREDLVSMRVERAKISAIKIKRLHRIVKIMRMIPFVRMVGITGRLAMKHAQQKSDWDLLIVLKGGRIWTGRFLVTMALHTLGKRRHGNMISDRVCLNYFITEDSLEVITKDIFSANEYTFLFPLFGWETYKRFQIKNQWIRTMKLSYAPTEVAPLKMISDAGFSKQVRTWCEHILNSDTLERYMKQVQHNKIMRNPKTSKGGSLIYAHDGALVFLPRPHGPHVFENFKKRMEHIGL